MNFKIISKIVLVGFFIIGIYLDAWYSPSYLASNNLIDSLIGMVGATALIFCAISWLRFGWGTKILEWIVNEDRTRN